MATLHRLTHLGCAGRPTRLLRLGWLALGLALTSACASHVSPAARHNARPTEPLFQEAAPMASAQPPALTFWDCAQAAERCPDDAAHWQARLSVPPGFAVSVVGRVPEGYAPSALTYGPDGRLYVALTPRPFEEGFTGAIAVLTETGDWERWVDGLWLPTGLVFAPGTDQLYVSSRAGRFEGQVSVVAPDGRLTPVVTGLPCCYSAAEHQPNGLAFGPDGWLYVAIGARSDHGEPAWGETEPRLDPLEAGILRMQPDGQNLMPYAGGLRNPYGLDFDIDGRLWTDDNGPDFGPPEKLIQVEAGQHYGFPYYPDCEVCPNAPEGLVITAPYVEFAPHATPTGLVVYKGRQFPASYANSIFVALWNPGPGGRVVRVYAPGQVDDFVTGLWGPVDVTLAPDGALVVADNLSGYVFAIRWAGGSAQ